MVRELLNQDITIRIEDIGREKAIGVYFEFLRKCYGDKLFVNILDYVVVLSTSFEPITIKELVFLVHGGDITISDLSIMNNLKFIIRAERSYRGNLYYIDNMDYKEYIEKNYPDRIKEKALGFVQLIEEGLRISQKDIDGMSYVLAYVWDYCNKYGETNWCTPEIAKRINDFAVEFERTDDKGHRLRRLTFMYTGAGYILKPPLGDFLDGDQHKLLYMCLYRNLIKTYFKIKQFQSAFKCGENISEIYLSLPEDLKNNKNYKIILAHTNIDMMICYGELRYYDKFENLYLQTSKLANEIEDPVLRNHLDSTYVTGLRNYNPRLTIEKLKKMVASNNDAWDRYSLANMHIVLGNAHSSVGEHHEGFVNYNYAVELMHNAHLPQNLFHLKVYASALRYRGQHFVAQKMDFDSGIRDMEQALSILGSLRIRGNIIDDFEVARILTSLAMAYANRKFEDDTKKALLIISRAEAIWLQTINNGMEIDTDSMVNTYINYGIVLDIAGKTKEGIDKLMEVIKVVDCQTHFNAQKKFGAKNLQAVYIKIAEFYDRIGDIKNRELYRNKVR